MIFVCCCFHFVLSLGLVHFSLCHSMVGNHLAQEKIADCCTYSIYVFICVSFLVNGLGANGMSFVPLYFMVTWLSTYFALHLQNYLSNIWAMFHTNVSPTRSQGQRSNQYFLIQSKRQQVLLLLTFCLSLLPLWESVIVLCIVVRYFMSILVLQSS